MIPNKLSKYAVEAVCNLWMWNVPEYSKDKYKRASKLFEFVYVSDKLMSWDML